MSNQPSDAAWDRVAVVLDGLSVGDALGEQFFHLNRFDLVTRRVVPDPFWCYTDDTEMALAISQVLQSRGHIDQDELATEFARRYRRNPRRGYGATAHQILTALNNGKPWRVAAKSAFHGEGSMGNGAAMRVAPIGAYFADDPQVVTTQAARSAEVTHAHAEGIAGAIAIALAVAWVWRGADARKSPELLLDHVLQFTPPSETRAGIERARMIPLDQEVSFAAGRLGNGSRVIAADTVPLALWCAARHLDNYEDALWSTIAAGGDIDTNCAIVGGIVASAVGRAGIPKLWLESREDLL